MNKIDDRKIHFQHVKDHTGLSDFFSRGNAIADEAANRAAGQNKEFNVPEWLLNSLLLLYHHYRT